MLVTYGVVVELYSESKNISVTYHYDLAKNQNLELRYSLANGGGPAGDTTGSQNQSIYLAYSYRF